MDRDQGRRPSRRGRLRIFLGAAAGVGKTYAMLGQARDFKAAGVDVVIGYLEAHGRRATEDRAAGIEVAPRRVARRGGRTFTEMDVDWILERSPQLCLVDELAHTNHPGGRNAKRWQDVEELLEAGIDVDTTVNIQHLESLNDKIYEITGVRVRETFPDRLLHQADSVVVVDMPPEALRERTARAGGSCSASRSSPTSCARPTASTSSSSRTPAPAWRTPTATLTRRGEPTPSARGLAGLPRAATAARIAAWVRRASEAPGRPSTLAGSLARCPRRRCCVAAAHSSTTACTGRRTRSGRRSGGVARVSRIAISSRG